MAYKMNIAAMLQQMLEVCTMRRQACLTPTEHGLPDTLEHTVSFCDCSSSTAESCHRIHFRLHRIVIHDSFEGPRERNQGLINQVSVGDRELVHHTQSIN